MQIPLHNQRVTATGSQPLAQASGASVGGAVARLGETVSSLGFAYQEKMDKLKYDSDISDYNVRVNKLRNEVAESRNQALLNGGSIDDATNVVFKRVSEFNTETGKRGYGKNAIKDITERWGIDSEDIGSWARQEHQKFLINDMTTRIEMDANQLVTEDGDFTAADQKLELLSGALLPSQIMSIKTGMRNAYYTGLAETYQQQRDDGLINSQQYVMQLEELDGRIDGETILDAGQQAQLHTIARARIHREKVLYLKDAIKVSEDIVSKIGSGEATPEVFAEAGLTLDPEKMKSIEKTTVQTGKTAGAAEIEGYDKTERILQQMVDGEIYMDEAFDKIAKLDTSAGAIAEAMALRYMKEIAETQDTIFAYDVFWGTGKKISVDGNTKKFIYDLTYYTRLQKDKGAYLKSKMKSFARWQETDDAGNKQSYDEFRKILFEPDAKHDAYLAPSEFVAPPKREKVSVNIGGQRTYYYKDVEQAPKQSSTPMDEVNSIWDEIP